METQIRNLQQQAKMLRQMKNTGICADESENTRGFTQSYTHKSNKIENAGA